MGQIASSLLNIHDSLTVCDLMIYLKDQQRYWKCLLQEVSFQLLGKITTKYRQHYNPLMPPTLQPPFPPHSVQASCVYIPFSV